MKTSASRFLTALAVTTLTVTSAANAALTWTPTELDAVGGANQIFNTVNFNPADLTTYGPSDWSYWGWSSGAIVETNGKLGGNLIGVPTTPGTITSDQDDAGPGVVGKFSFTDGTSPAADSNVNAGAGMWDGGSWQDSVPNPELQFTVPVGPGTNTLHLWFSLDKANGILLDMLDSGANVIGTTLNLSNLGGDSRRGYLYKIDYGGADSPDTVSFRLSLNGRQQNDTRIVLNAAALQQAVIPEPASLALLATGGLLILGRRRRA